MGRSRRSAGADGKCGRANHACRAGSHPRLRMPPLRTTLIVALTCLVVGAGAGLTLAGLNSSSTRGQAVSGPRATAVQPPPPTTVDSTACKPPPQHPDPVVLVPGTFDATSWATIAPA